MLAPHSTIAPANTGTTSILTYYTMAITELDPNAPSGPASNAKIVFVTLLFLLSLAAFICQTEFTSQAYALGFKEPIILLLLTHGLWWLLWPIQVVSVAFLRTAQRVARGPSSYERLGAGTVLLATNQPPPADQPAPVTAVKYFKKCLIKQIHNVYHTAILVYEANANGDESTTDLNLLVTQNPHLPTNSSLTACVRVLVATPAFRYLATKTAIISVVLNLAGLTWYAAMSMTYASDVTAIYNCSAFTAYAFAIPILHEKFTWLKMSSVAVAVFGVFVVAYSGSDAPAGEGQYPYRLWGNLLISVGAVLYGYYEVLYKKYACIPSHTAALITPRRQLTFANFVMAMLGGFTLVLLLTAVTVVEVLHIHHFNWFDYGTNTAKIGGYVLASIVSNLLFSGAFLSLMALTSPVLSSVSSLLTIFLIGIVEWVLFGNALGKMQLLGDALVIVGFTILTAASWKEISEGQDEDDIETASFYSFAPSENTIATIAQQEVPHAAPRGPEV